MERADTSSYERILHIRSIAIGLYLSMTHQSQETQPPSLCYYNRITPDGSYWFREKFFKE